jgi:carbonic anhydrase
MADEEAQKDLAPKRPDHHRTISHYLQQNQDRIFENNRKWVAAKKEADPQFFEKLSAGQAPEYL